ncbi:hypothetical protein BJX61DRAFT_118508 [Aspergillus egyptiacus]|nr:hypothetical protein BJX61DRAFT_118508 [Aspergillus egyptiacus]
MTGSLTRLWQGWGSITCPSGPRLCILVVGIVNLSGGGIRQASRSSWPAPPGPACPSMIRPGLFVGAPIFRGLRGDHRPSASAMLDS